MAGPKRYHKPVDPNRARFRTVREPGSLERRLESGESDLPAEALYSMMEFDYSERPETPLREGLKRPTAARVGESVDPGTHRYRADVDVEGYEWVVPSRTTNAARPFSLCVGYSREEHKVRVLFREGSPASHGLGTWAYEDVTPSEWYAIRRTASTGKYFIRHLFGKPNQFESFNTPISARG